ncbi:MAG: AMP-binding protein [Bacteroidales bacterium]|nr:AMP-binding protein [Bacteroidales bacterium]
MKESLLHISNSADYNVMPNTEKNILENFITEFSKNKNEHFAWDANSGGSTRKSFFLKAAVVSQLIKAKVKGGHVGIMLPALQSTALLVIASYMAGKVPVMLNWTVGHKVLSHCVKIADIDVIITATAFYDKIQDQIPDDIKKHLFLLDKEVKNISLGMKLKGMLMAKLPHQFINTKIDETAVILFTSGSETLPKAVPLTHRNVVSNLWGALQLFDIRVNGIFLAFLPPFHSFGFTVLSVLPLITGVKVAYTPNPTSLKEVAEVLIHTKANNIIVTPTLLKMLMARTTKEDLSSVELVISGAESLHKDILNKFKKITENKSLIVEGYGITECSPIVSLNPTHQQKLNSVGKFIHGLDHYIMDLETEKPVAVGQEGMIVVNGTSVFKGYLDKNIDNPFVDINGVQFYKTGDIGHIDDDGFLYITGRLKRFIKIGGEMISMPFIEKILEDKYGEEGRNVLAVEGCDKTKTPIVTLFTVNELDLAEVNKYMREHGVAAIAKIRDIQVLDEIPLLGTGKTNYRLLKEMVKKEEII